VHERVDEQALGGLRYLTVASLREVPDAIRGL
jgi:hypothetical protein